ncbi:LysM peptidoglycan-binding domain-containing protein [Ruania suaedae]|uniref:LysM peptidoglycan-binding domain-containing protein n=1 Tax=Ruania suaedae TaxID=2897774 RepID=UPI001E564D44|nr:LysM peptidoglycan-binding domain-containing protein [Ruania suaedae]UFU01630.1 LysM peptidoglycan-binding domain-containing protein [Ruania suaedae]
MTRTTTRRSTRRPSAFATLGALGAATAVGLGATAVPAAAAPQPAPSPVRGEILRSVAPQLAPVTAHTPARRAETLYTVRAGDTVSHLALRYGTSVRAIVDANDLGRRAIIRIGQTLRIPGSSSSGSSSSGSNSSGSGSSSSGSSSSSSAKTHRVVAGDTVSALAARHGTTVRAIISANGLNSNALIRIGQTLRIPGSSSSGSSSGSGSSSSGSSSSSNNSGSSSSSSGNSSSSSAKTHRVVAGDTVSALAARHGTTVRAIISANGLNSNALIRIGQTLRIPGSSSSGSSSSGSSNSGSSSNNSGSNNSGSSSGSQSSVVHRVISGDTVSSIATQYGSSVSAIMEANNLASAGVIRVGQRLQVPSGLVSNTFLHYTYGSDVTAAANANKRTLLATSVPSREQMQQMIRSTATRMGVDPALALAVAYQESGFNMRAVSPANAIGVMQVIPTSGEWASTLVGRQLNLLDPQDNVTAGVAILRTLHRMTDDEREAIGGYYQGLGSVQRNGLYDDTRRYVANIQTLMTRYS